MGEISAELMEVWNEYLLFMYIGMAIEARHIFFKSAYKLIPSKRSQQQNPDIIKCLV